MLTFAAKKMLRGKKVIGDGASFHKKKQQMPTWADAAYEPLTNEHGVDCGNVRNNHRHQGPFYSRWLCVGVHLLLIMLYTALSVFFVCHWTKDSLPRRDAFPGLKVNYNLVKYEPFSNSTYIGQPSPTNEQAWHALMDTMAIRVTAHELALHDQQSVALPQGGHLAWLGVFHELHCVKVLRQWVWREHYPNLSNLSDSDMAHHMVHNEHCLEVLRNSAQCRADTEALTVFKWTEESPRPVFDTKQVHHRCVDWNDLLSSSYADRVVTRDELQRMTNPLMG